MRLTIVLQSSEEGGYTAQVPLVPECISEGDTREEALANIRKALRLYIEAREAHFPLEPGAIVEKIEV